MPQIPVCLRDNRLIYTSGTIYHNQWTIGPAYSAQFGFTRGAWSVRSLDNGILIATFTDLQIAIRFAGWVWETYGDLRQTMINCYHRQETPEDSAILDAIERRSLHVSRLRNGDTIRFIPV